MEKFVAVIEKAPQNYSAYLPDVPGCISTGSTLDETLHNIREALEFHLETLADEGAVMPVAFTLESHLSNGDIILEEDVVIAYVTVDIRSESATHS
ncbi:type II toxin-antitoxin system HicB family antitoxin [Foetidibacter luteolus]|uniref:type II toxin-antitoxin system HicB family antitoxin n=1 Tax=Foetidibacter luteolus TaxID=2608880 RepID=UPI00129B0871|nr:type II toxin-antitoxin system HicB family antitoxin [Foetidibacter luteolus]